MLEQYNEVLEDLLAHQNTAPIKPRLPMRVYEDSTSEALLSDFSENTPNAFLSSSEGGTIFNSRIMTNTPILNSLISGDSVTVNRKTEEIHTAEDPRLTINIMTQWSPLEGFMSRTKDDVLANGFLSRFLVCAPRSNCGYRQSNGIVCSSERIKEFNERLYKLLSQAAELDDYKQKTVIKFSDGAKRIWLDVYNDVEAKMAPGGIYQYVKGHASKLLEIVARLAALNHSFDNASEDEISAATLVESINLVGYFSSQFMNIFCKPPKYVVDAQNLMQWFGAYINSGVRYLKRTTVMQCGPIGTRKKKDLEPALEYLRPNFHIRELVSKKTRVIDLMSHIPFDGDKLKQDLSLEVVL